LYRPPAWQLIHGRGERLQFGQDSGSLIGLAAAATSNIGTELASFSTWARESRKRYPQTRKDWPVQKELIGLFDELAAFNERIAELTKQGHQSLAMDVLKAQAISLAAQIDELRCILIVPKQ
jgi:hypothetical protein